MADDGPVETFDASDPAAVNNANREDKRREREDADVLRRLMHDKKGRAFLYRLLSRCNIYDDPFAPGQSDVTSFRLGQANIGKQLMLAAMDASTDLYVQMVREQKDEELRLDEVRRKEAEMRQANDPAAPAPVMTGMIDLPPPNAFVPQGQQGPLKARRRKDK